MDLNEDFCANCGGAGELLCCGEPLELHAQTASHHHPLTCLLSAFLFTRWVYLVLPHVVRLAVSCAAGDVAVSPLPPQLKLWCLPEASYALMHTSAQVDKSIGGGRGMPLIKSNNVTEQGLQKRMDSTIRREMR
jgi:hypothetical protein